MCWQVTIRCEIAVPCPEQSCPWGQKSASYLVKTVHTSPSAYNSVVFTASSNVDIYNTLNDIIMLNVKSVTRSDGHIIIPKRAF